jgi:hypothetical protein
VSSLTAREFQRAAKIIDRHVSAIYGDWWLQERSVRRDADHGTGQPNAILMEGCYGWTDITFDDQGEALRAELRALGLFVEAYSGWAIHVYRI